MGEHWICSGTAALSQITSLCGMPLGGGKHSQTLHRNYLLLITNSLEQAGGKLIDQLTLVPPADSGLPANRLTKSQLESQWVLLTKQSDPVYLKLTELTTSGMTSQILRLVRANMLCFSRVHIQWGTNSHGGTKILHFSKIPPLLVPSLYETVYTLVFTWW